MCGIAGIISLNNNAIDTQLLVKMTRQLASRGPDGDGYLFSGRGFDEKPDVTGRNTSFVKHDQELAFGHQRLATTDLSTKAGQPMTDATKRYWIVFNGQIYNHVELRRELESYGHKFITDHSDTEVILNAYKHWGDKCLGHLKGIWAFCLWDSKENKILLSRDRMGKQPLFYTVHDKKLYFASELNSLLVNPSINPRLDDFAVYDYLTYANVPAPKTIFRDIFKLPASHFISFRPGEKINYQRFWNPIDFDEPLQMNEDDIIEEIQKKIFEGVRLRMQSDVKVGMLLSGGLDSSVTLASMSRFASNVPAYTVGFENKNHYRNEFAWARRVADIFGAQYNELIVSDKDFLDILPTVTYLQDEPIADTANIPLYFISKKAHEDGIKILLSGEGSDEIFIGYQHWRLIYEYEKIFRNRPVMATAFGYLHRNSMFRNKRPYYSAWSDKTKNRWPVFWSGTELRTEDAKRKILSADFLSKVGNYNSFVPKSDLYNELISRKKYDTFKWMSINDLMNRLPDQLLARLDRMTMASSVEGRNPFLDIDLVEFMLRVPSHLKTRKKTEKYLLKRAFEGILPNDIIYRKKDSFTVPLTELFRDGKRKMEYMREIVEFNSETGIFSNQYITQLSGPKHIREFWTTLNFALWYKSHK